MSVGFPPLPAYPSGIDNNYTLFLVHNTTEAELSADNSAWAQELNIVPVGADEDEIWADNGFANIEGELFYYDAVEKDSNGKVRQLKRCARNIGGKKTKFNPVGTVVRGFVVAQHHNQLVDAICRIEKFVGINFDTNEETLDFRIRCLRDVPTCQDDAGCPSVDFEFEVIEDDPCLGVLGEYSITITGNFTNYRLDFGDGDFTLSELTGQHRFLPGVDVDPVVTVGNDSCQVVQTPITRENPQEPTFAPTEEPFFIPVPDPPQPPTIIPPTIEFQPPELELPPLVFPCVDIPDLSVVSVSIPSIVLPSVFVITPSLSPIQITGPTFSPIQITGPTFSPIQIVPSLTPIQITGPSLTPIQMSFPSITPIQLTGPSLTPIQMSFPSITPITMMFPSITPISMTYLSLSPISMTYTSLSPISMSIPSLSPISMSIPSIDPISVDWSPIPTLSCNVVVSCQSAGGFRAQSRSRSFNEDFIDSFTDVNDELEIDVSDIGIPSEIIVRAPKIPDLELRHNLPKEINLKIPNIPDIEIKGAENIPRDIRVYNDDVPTSIPLTAPKSISVALELANKIPAIEVKMPEFPSEIPMKVTGLPDRIQVTGFPDSISITGIPERLPVFVPEDTVIPVAWKGSPIQVEDVKVKIELDVQKLTGEGEDAPNCVMIVPCPKK